MYAKIVQSMTNKALKQSVNATGEWRRLIGDDVICSFVFYVALHLCCKDDNASRPIALDLLLRPAASIKYQPLGRFITRG